MIIKEVPAEGNLTIEVSLKERKLEFHSQCVESGVNYIYAQPIRIDGKILSFNSEGHLMVNLIYLREEKNPIVWKGVGITTVQNNGKNVYKIVASGEGFEMNRRESFRLFLGLGAVVQIGSNKKAVNVILKDISENGFSFVEIEDIDAENLPVRLVFNDMKTGISLIGNIVRKVRRRLSMAVHLHPAILMWHVISMRSKDSSLLQAVVHVVQGNLIRKH